MNIQRLPEHIIRWSVIIFGILFGLYSVKMAGQSQYGRLLLIYSVLGYIAMALLIGPRIWVAIPVMWGLSGQIPALEVPFTIRDLGVMLVYICIGFLAYWVLSRCSIREKSSNKLVYGMVAGRMVEGVAAQFLKWFPALTGFLATYYQCSFFMWAVEPDEMTFVPGAESTARLGYLVVIGQPLALALCAFCWPLGLLNPVRIWRPVALLTALYCILLSGFRSSIAVVGAFFTVSAFFWEGRRGIAKMSLVGALVLAFVCLGQGTFFDLPRSAQRALSFIPYVQWDEYSILEAKASTDWRVDMWREMLTTDRYIENHLLGDGFGFKKRDLELMFYYKKYGNTQDTQESFMISGAVHSGPVSTVRYVGYVGLVITTVVLVGMAITGWKLIRRAKGTPFFPLALFICIPVVVEPANFWFIIGSFESMVSDGLFTLGLLRMIRNSLDDRAPEKVPVAGLDVSKEAIVPSLGTQPQ
jgi:hypothetical protein